MTDIPDQLVLRIETDEYTWEVWTTPLTPTLVNLTTWHSLLLMEEETI
mgnify:CR=1 FL=1